MRISARIVSDLAEDILRVSEDGTIDKEDFKGITHKLLLGGYDMEIATLELGMTLIQVHYNALRNQKQVLH